MRVEQPAGARGSLKWMQAIVTSGRDLIEPNLRSALDLPATAAFTWHSPIPEDRWAEYRDRSFLRRVGLDLAPNLEEFWPRGGPQWDGLASSSGKLVLVEAKAHIRELVSSCAASPRSCEQIERALNEARAHIGASPDGDWLNRYYQYANRLAHLHFLRACGVDAHLVFLYFIRDQQMGGPGSVADWEDALAGVYQHLGLDPQKRITGVHSIYVDVQVVSAPLPLA